MEEQPSLFSTAIDAETQGYLADAAKWARILGIAGIVLVVLAVAARLYNAYISRNNASEIFGGADVPYSVGLVLGTLLFALIPIAPMVFLLRFANAVGLALETNDQAQMRKGLQVLKRFFRYLAIVCILLLLSVGVSFLLGIAGLLSNS